MTAHKLFITVGTTQFESLIEKITSEEVLAALGHIGFSQVTLQVGNGTEDAVLAAQNKNNPNFPSIFFFRFKNSISEDIAAADLVISHAGSGSILDCLCAGKKLLVVINDELMDNHQMELAQKMAEEGYLKFCFISDVPKCLLDYENWGSLKPYPAGEPEKFTSYIEGRLGFGET